MKHAGADASKQKSKGQGDAAARPRGWDEAALRSLLALEDVDTLLMTDGAGLSRYEHARAQGTLSRDELAAVVDTALGAIARAGSELAFGAPLLLATRYRDASLVAALAPSLCAVVLAKPDANLAQLLLLLRQLVRAP